MLYLKPLESIQHSNMMISFAHADLKPYWLNRKPPELQRKPRKLYVFLEREFVVQIPCMFQLGLVVLGVQGDRGLLEGQRPDLDLEDRRRSMMAMIGQVIIMKKQ